MNTTLLSDFTPGFTCPLPVPENQHITLAHGSGGKLTHRLIDRIFLPLFRNEYLEFLHDGAALTIGNSRIAMATDSYVIRPIFFPGGDIGSLAVNGTVNDLAMCGAKPLYLSVAFIIEEGLPIEVLQAVAQSMQRAAELADVVIVTGDTKVVDKGKGDKIFLNTTGLGIIDPGIDINPGRAQIGDRIIINGGIGQHGVAVLSKREGLEFQTTIESDCAPLSDLVGRMLRTGQDIHVLRDPTRGGIACALNEIAIASKTGIRIVEENIPISEEVQGACEILGLDPLYIANEGKVLAWVPEKSVEEILRVMREHPLGKESVVIGEVIAEQPGTVTLRSRIGGLRVVDVPTGEQLPRIC